MRNRPGTIGALLLIICTEASAGPVKVTDMHVSGEIDGANITFTVDCHVTTAAKGQRLEVISGDVVLDEIKAAGSGYTVHYDAEGKTYSLSWQKKGKRRVTASFAVRPAHARGDLDTTGTQTLKVTAVQNALAPLRTGIVMEAGQVFYLKPYTEDQWTGGGTRKGKYCDYRGYPGRRGWMQMRYKVGDGAEQPVVADQRVVADRSGELLLLVGDGKVDDNDGEIRVDVSRKASPWREALFTVPAARYRRLELLCDRTDLEVVFPGAMRVERKVADARLVMTAVSGAGRPFAVRWKPQVQELDAKLVFASEANTIVTAAAGALRVDSLFVFDISQGKMRQVTLDVPAKVSVTQVRGGHIRDWQLSGGDDGQVLEVQFNRPVEQTYALAVVAEAPLGRFPASGEVPVISPRGGIRSGGHLAVGTDSAITLLVEHTAGVSQIDGAAFKRVVFDENHPRPLPQGKAFYYSFAGSTYQLRLAMDDIVPSYDASYRAVATVDDEDLLVEVEIELDVRDAPLRSVTVELPAGYLVSDVRGPAVGDHSVHEAAEGGRAAVEVQFVEPLQGRTLVGLRLELGRSPLDSEQLIDALSVRGAKNERGFVAIVAAEGIALDQPAASELREVHTGSLPVRVAGATYAYRFREKGWSMRVRPQRRRADIRAELFHLVSIAEGVAYGGVAANYFIAGSPIDELHFVVPAELEHVEFVGRDVLQTVRDADRPNRYTVKLARKVTGDYNLGVTYTQAYQGEQPLLIGGVQCEGAVQTGFMTIASQLDVELAATMAEGSAVLEIAREEVPANYRLMVTAPILKTYKYVATPHQVSVTVRPFARGKLLSVVVELMDIETHIARPQDGAAQSVTSVRYMVKNATEQFLALSMPPGVDVWTTHVVTGVGAGAPVRAKVTASHDKAKGQLLVPLPRMRDPNQPIGVEVKYGQVHDGGATRGGNGGDGQLVFEAPRTAAQSTFDQWTIHAEPHWALHPAGGGTMTVAGRAAVGGGSLLVMLRGLGESWREPAEYWGTDIRSAYAGAGAIALLVIVSILKRRALLSATVGLALAAVIWLGVGAAGTGAFDQLLQSDVLTTLRFTQEVSMEGQTPLRAVVQMTPAWRQHATVRGAIVIPAVGVVCLLGAVFVRKLRPVLAAAGLAGLAFGAVEFEPSAKVLAHGLTWGLASLLGVWYVWQGVIRPTCVSYRASQGATATGASTVVTTALGALIVTLALPACAAATSKAPDDGAAAGPADILQRVEADVTVGDDSMQVELSLQINVDGPRSFKLLDTSAVLMSDERPGANMRIIDKENRYVLSVSKKGTYRAKLTFLAPLAAADANQQRRIELPLPAALTNRVRLHVPATALQVESPTAMRFGAGESDGVTTAEAVFGPEDAAVFVWKPRARRPERERTNFYVETAAVAVLDTGLARTHHHLNFQIAQGQLTHVLVQVGGRDTVTSVSGDHIGAWRFDPASRQLEVRLRQPAEGQYDLLIVTQVPADALPYTAELSALRVPGAKRQRGTLGLAHSEAVYLDAQQHPQVMNVDDFARGAAALLQTIKLPVRHAYRLHGLDDVTQVLVLEVKPELRAVEQAGFTVADDRLVYSGQLDVVIHKAGVFGVELRLPIGFDIDALTNEHVSHWDEQLLEEQSLRAVHVHFRNRMIGPVALQLALSRPVAQLPAEVAVPRVELVGAQKHTGRIIVSADRGVGLSIAGRVGVSELDPLELGLRPQQQKPILAFKLLRPQWQLSLNTNVVQPRITVDALHVARVTEGLVRHVHYLRYTLENAGAKTFDIQVPADAMGLVISGATIARRQRTDADNGVWRIELSEKWYDRPYMLKVQYETRFDRQQGDVVLEPVMAKGAQLQRGHIVIMATPRVSLTATQVGEALRPDVARNVPPLFAAGDLSDAVLCYRTASLPYRLSLRAQRHGAHALLEADVQRTTMATVVTEDGQSLTRVELLMQVGSKRHLQTILPKGATMWSLQVNGRPITPSIQPGAGKGGEDVHLLPLAQAAAGELSVRVDFIYVAPAPAAGKPLPNAQSFDGPRFDLPLRDIRWALFLPAHYDYRDFGGTLAVNEEIVEQWLVEQYDIAAYHAEVQQVNVGNRAEAVKLLQKGTAAARAGKQRQARQALESAWHFSLSDSALNEDARVQLNQLVEQQAMVGLLGSRGRLRQQMGQSSEAAAASQVDENFRQEDAERLTNALNKDDSENLERITRRIVQLQQAAADTAAQLVVNMPLRGRVIEFNRPIQVKPFAPLIVEFDAAAEFSTHAKQNYAALAATAIAFMLLFTAMTFAGRQFRRISVTDEPPASDPIEASDPQAQDG